MTAERPEWQVVIVDGQPQQVVNPAMLRELVKVSPLGPKEARRRLIAAGVPPQYLEEES